MMFINNILVWWFRYTIYSLKHPSLMNPPPTNIVGKIHLILLVFKLTFYVLETYIKENMSYFIWVCFKN